MSEATAMWAKDLRLSSHWSHFWSFWPKPMLALRAGRWCHITPSDSGTRPNILALNFFTIVPYRPVIAFEGILVVMTPPGVWWLRQH
jgi:hypothetical protein